VPDPQPTGRMPHGISRTLTPEQRSARSKLASDARWAGTADRTASTAPARAGQEAKLRREHLEKLRAKGIEPDTLPPDVLEKMFTSYRKAHYARLSFLASKALAAKKAAQAKAAADAEGGGDVEG